MTSGRRLISIFCEVPWGQALDNVPAPFILEGVHTG